MKKWHLVIDVEKCENCHNCFLSCKDEHVDNDWPGYAAPQSGEGPSWINVKTKERGSFPLIDVGYLPLPCMHCDDAPCIKAAGNGAIYKRADGIVIIDPVKAKGEKTLVKSCPYGVIQWNEQLALPQKCTLCAHLLDQGWKKTRCVQACPTGALTLLQVEETETAGIAERERFEAYRPDLNAKPSTWYKNLYRYTRAFIAGSVATRVADRDECAEGAKVTLSNSAGEIIAETVADSFGDFKFDNLEEGSGTYRLKTELAGHETKTVDITLNKSITVGTIFI
jgi:Fe-S-cluster-containing dehydrogenase component